MKRLVGKLGRADAVTRRTRPDQEATLSAWVVHAPQAHPVFTHWFVGAIHLRDLPGVKSALRDYPEAEHEVFFQTFSPEFPPDPERPEEFRFLKPLCLRMQLAGLEDGEVIRRTLAGIKLVLAGELPLEPDDMQCFRMTRKDGGILAEGQDAEYMARWLLHFAGEGYQAVNPLLLAGAA